jgi:hypothetical protein
LAKFKHQEDGQRAGGDVLFMDIYIKDMYVTDTHIDDLISIRSEQYYRR